MKNATPIIIETCKGAGDIQQILDLQALNLPVNLTTEELLKEGFVTLRHDFELLSEMNKANPHVVAKQNGRVVGYALMMSIDFERKLAVLAPMFALLKNLKYLGRKLTDYKYYVMGQICVEQQYRGFGLFEKLYAEHKRLYSDQYDLCITEIAVRNTRSMRAHEKVGFKTIHSFRDETDSWNIVAWDWK